MNASEKRIGDRVTVTAGEFKDRIGTITQQQSQGWIIELDDAQQVSVDFPMVRLADQPSSGETAVSSVGESMTEQKMMTDEIDSQSGVELAPTGEIEELPMKSANEPAGQTTESINFDLAKLRVVQLKELAKHRGVSIARTKEDFIRIIKEINPEEDLSLLKGRILFDRVNELHISRLRSKRNLIERLSGE